MSTIDLAYSRFSKTCFPLPSERDVMDLEQRLGISLPEDYRDFLLRYNGGYFTEPVIEPPDLGTLRDRLTHLKGIGASHPTAELGRPRDLALFDDNDPLEILPIGYTIMGGLIFLVAHADGFGEIGLKAAFGRSYPLATGIEEFFALLIEPEDTGG
jgi:hypothetical protein